jgi:uncharacterized protein YfaQ (DUF2300 family)
MDTAMSAVADVPCRSKDAAHHLSAARYVACMGTGTRASFRVTAAVVVAFTIACCPLPASGHEAIGPSHCQHLPTVQAWLDLHIDRWDAILAAEPGYERPASVIVCAAPTGRPFADNRADRIFVRGIQTVDEQITVAHEYTHIAFQHYPSGHNEGYVEHTARRLIAENP